MIRFIRKFADVGQCPVTAAMIRSQDWVFEIGFGHRVVTVPEGEQLSGNRGHRPEASRLEDGTGESLGRLELVRMIAEIAVQDYLIEHRSERPRMSAPRRRPSKNASRNQ